MIKRKNELPVVFILGLLLILSVLLNLLLLYQQNEKNRVIRVIDGDSFDMVDGRRIRLLGIDAPERNYCYYQEARHRLSQLINNKKVRLTDLVTDDYGRILANVFVSRTLVNQIMVEEGMAKFTYVTSPYYQQIKQASIRSKNGKKGIYSPLCQNTTPVTDCQIKANISSTGDKIYHLLACRDYGQTTINEAFGDQWFCSENEAIGAGFRKSKLCF